MLRKLDHKLDLIPTSRSRHFMKRDLYHWTHRKKLKKKRFIKFSGQLTLRNRVKFLAVFFFRSECNGTNRVQCPSSRNTNGTRLAVLLTCLDATSLLWLEKNLVMGRVGYPKLRYIMEVSWQVIPRLGFRVVLDPSLIWLEEKNISMSSRHHNPPWQVFENLSGDSKTHFEKPFTRASRQFEKVPYITFLKSLWIVSQ